MSALLYRTLRVIGTPVFDIASRETVLHADRVPRTGGCIMAANHESVFDPVLLIKTTPRIIHFLSIVELFRNPLSRWFFTAMRAHPLDRSRPDAGAVRTILRDLRRGQLVGIFPQGAVQGKQGAELQPDTLESVARLAQISKVPLMPCLVHGGAQFQRWQSWLPLRRTRWLVAYGQPVGLRPLADREAQRAALLEDFAASLQALTAEVDRLC